jgi:beta-barrel assembly-enhancing protease
MPTYYDPRASRRRFSPKLIIALVIAAASAFSYFGTRSTNDVTGEVQHVKISPEQEVAIGLQAAPEMAAQFGGLIENDQLASHVEDVGQDVIAKSAAKGTPYKFEFHVLADPKTINAFALPGGQVFITMGLLERLTTDDQLAGVLGHEVGHVVGRHGAEQLAKQEFSAGLIGAAGVATYDPDDPYRSARTAAMAAAVSQMVNMKFGREAELEADALGVRFMKETGHDPHGMLELLQILADSGGGSRAPEFFSTHPNPENRIQRIKQMIGEQGVGGSGLPR